LLFSFLNPVFPRSLHSCHLDPDELWIRFLQPKEIKSGSRRSKKKVGTLASNQSRPFFLALEKNKETHQDFFFGIISFFIGLQLLLYARLHCYHVENNKKVITTQTKLTSPANLCLGD